MESIRVKSAQAAADLAQSLLAVRGQGPLIVRDARYPRLDGDPVPQNIGMPWNFRRRVEIMFPIENHQLKRRIVDGILGVLLADNVKARELQPDGAYRHVRPPGPNDPVIRCQVEFQNMAIELCETSPISHPATAMGPTVGE
jgi:Polyphosphate kinase C-terminal domain 2